METGGLFTAGGITLAGGSDLMIWGNDSKYYRQNVTHLSCLHTTPLCIICDSSLLTFCTRLLQEALNSEYKHPLILT